MDEEPAFERCYCTNADRAAVLAAIAAGDRTVNALRARLGVCGGCGTCRPEVEALLREREGARWALTSDADVGR